MADDIISSDGHSIFARRLNSKTVEIRRSRGKDKEDVFTITGKDFSIVGSPAKGKSPTTIIVKDGKVDEDSTTGRIAVKEDYDKNGNLRSRVVALINKYGDEFIPEKHNMTVDLDEYKTEEEDEKDEKKKTEEGEGDEE